MSSRNADVKDSHLVLEAGVQLLAQSVEGQALGGHHFVQVIETPEEKEVKVIMINALEL